MPACLRVLVPWLAACGWAAELPVRALLVTPQGAVVTRCGELPAGDQVVDGLPAGLERGSLVVSADGGPLPAWRVEEPPPRAAAASVDSLRLVGSGLAGRRVTVTYRLPEAGWRPRYRIAVADGAAELQVAAVVELRGQDHWPALPLELVDSQAPAAAVEDPCATLLGGGGPAGLFGSRGAGERPRALALAGGSPETGGAVERGLRRLDLGASSEGWWGRPPARVRTTAQVLLAYLGAGVDHRSPGNHRQQVRQGLALLAAQDPAGLGLGDLALCTAALAEAYGMAADPELRLAAQRSQDRLAERCDRRAEVHAALRQEGPLLAVRLAQAARTCVAAGLSAPLIARLDWLPAAAEAAADADAARVAEAALAGFLPQGGVALAADPAEAERWGQLAPAWLAAGRGELLECSAWAAFSAGSTAFTAWNRAAGDLLAVRQQTDGDWAGADGDPARLAALVSTLETCWRYRARWWAPPAPGEAGAGVAKPGQPGWRVGPVAIVPGQPVELAVGRWRLPGARGLSALPALDAQVRQRWQGVNPLPGPLPGGPCALMVDGRALDDIALPATLPGGVLAVPLGPEPRAQVVRCLASAGGDDPSRAASCMVLRWRLEAWPGCPPVEMVEPLPRTGPARPVLEFTDPPLAGAALEERRRRDPFWRHLLTPQDPERQVAWRQSTQATTSSGAEVRP
ncbi:MAG: hypothetical protein L6R48_02905 [Planctomycetes bacterium]|nr:hypothetical protein [Planctomycetota bacterium]